ncbi:MAG: PIN domain-containing protein [Deltaproteobacteria bacterium]|nr:PIN domain-containing protein [Deltaproteobacteria bacterium]
MPNRRPPTQNAFAARAPVLVDSGVWIALARARDQHHDAADTWMREALRRRVPLLTTNLILAEVHRFVLFHVGIRPALAVLEHIEASPSVAVVHPDAEHDRAARGWLTRFADQRLTYTDATSFAVMESHRCAAVLSFDHDFSTAGFRIGL